MTKEQRTFIGKIRAKAADLAGYVRRPGAWQLALIAVAALAVLFMPIPKPDTPPEPEPVFDPVKVVNVSVETPDEKPIKREDFVWTGAPNEPKTIRFASINSEGFIQKVAVDQFDYLSVPTNINLAGWYIDSAVPGQPGLSLIGGHVDGKTKPGIFKRLPDLKNNDIFEIELGNGTVHTFKVFKVHIVDVAAAENLIFAQDPAIASQLNLITCSDTITPGTPLQGKQVIVSSQLVN